MQVEISEYNIYLTQEPNDKIELSSEQNGCLIFNLIEARMLRDTFNNMILEIERRK